MMRKIGWRFYGEFIWDKQNCVGTRPALGSAFSPAIPNIRRRHEYILIYHKGEPRRNVDPQRIDITEEEFHKFTMSHWYIKGQRRLPPHHPDFHPAPYAEMLPFALIKLFSIVGDTILDPYNGSGTTCFVARALSRRFIGIDNAPPYVDFARTRIATLDGKTPSEMREMIQQIIQNDYANLNR